MSASYVVPMALTILPAGSPLDGEPGTLGVLSYNVLLPNAGAGWWVFKFYDPAVAEEHRAWPHRQALLRQQLAEARADVIALQEAVPDTFADDFAFLGEEGYAGELHRKGELRCATFWRRDRLELAAEAKHADRVLVTALRSVHDRSRVVLVLNGHLKAGPDPGRRLRQAAEALEQAARLARSLGLPLDRTPVVFCGDFNSEPAGSAVSQLLREGSVPPTAREAAYPEVELTSKVKTQPFGPLVDAHAEALGDRVPATLLLPDRQAYFADEAGAVRPAIVAAVRAMFERFAAGRGVMDRDAVAAWITTINRASDRGSELAKARAVFEARGVEQLTVDDLLGVYLAELGEGKVWGVYHDLHACGVAPAPGPTRVFEGRFDQIHHTPATLPLRAVRALLTDEQRERVFTRGETLPNAWHPSDHLPVGAVFAF